MIAQWLPFCLAFLMSGACEVFSEPAATTSADEMAQEKLTVEKALSLIRANNPALRAQRAAVFAASGRLRQARVFPNPEFEFESEGMPSNRFGSFSPASNTLILKQELVTAGKRKTGIATARKEFEIAEEDYALLEREILTEGKKTFFASLTAQERVAVTTRLLEVARRNAEATRRRVEAGDAALVETLRAEVALARTGATLRTAEKERDHARRDLMRLMGNLDAPLPQVSEEPVPTPRDSTSRSGAEDLAALETHPAWKRFALAQELAELELQKARRQPWPNLEVGLGIETAPGDETDNRQETFTLNLGLPLPLWDRTAGAIAEATANVGGAGHQAKAGRDELLTRLRQAIQAFTAAQDRVSIYTDQILPRSRRALELVTLSYQNGAIGQLEVLDAQQTLTEAELEHVDALGSLREALAEVEGLTGRNLGIESLDIKREDLP